MNCVLTIRALVCPPPFMRRCTGIPASNGLGERTPQPCALTTSASQTSEYWTCGSRLVSNIGILTCILELRRRVRCAVAVLILSLLGATHLRSQGSRVTQSATSKLAGATTAVFVCRISAENRLTALESRLKERAVALVKVAFSCSSRRVEDGLPHRTTGIWPKLGILSAHRMAFAP